jgi:diaminohydroxyphosphoribosylaminopyrimidine deaminase / 5-amino-6-(5-phosphoribosylamino)uracil reductase
MAVSPADLRFLDACIELAGRGLYSTSPNPRVGALLVRDGEVLGRGWHVRAGEGHAEVQALADARAKGHDPAGATCYVSLEPCSHQGRTPPCAEALVQAGIARVVGALDDPNPQVRGRGYQRLRDAGIQVDSCQVPAARQMNEGYVRRMETGRPWVRLKVAMSLDGRTAMASGESQWITGPEARADVQHWRARSCAVITGIGTVLADNPQLTVRAAKFAVDGWLRQPLRVVLDSRLQTPPTARLFAAEGPVLILGAAASASSRQDALARHAEVQLVDGPRPELADLLDELGRRDCNEVLFECGPRLAGSLLASGLWDELLLYVAPKLLGSEARPLAELPFARLDEALVAFPVDSVPVGADMRLRFLARSGASGGQTS